MADEPTDPIKDWRPRPDPTLLTTAALEREIAALHQLVKVLVAGEVAKLEARLLGMDKALLLLQAASDKVPSDVDTKITALKETYNERFASVQIQLADRTKMYEESNRCSKETVSAALQSAKEAVGKSEANTKEQINQLSATIGTMNGSLNEKIDASTGRAETAVGALRAELLPQITGERSRGDMGAGRQLGQHALAAVIFSSLSAIGVIVSIAVVLMRT